nr:MAG TPA: Integrase [Caudoviricetes sp.]
MWCEIRNNGSAVYCERYVDPLTEKVKKVSVSMPSASNQSKKKAQRILDAKINSIFSKTKQTKATLSDLLDAYSASQKITCKLSTAVRNERVIKLVIDLLGADTIVDNITSQYFNEQLLSSGKPIVTLNSYITRFRAMLNWGYKNDYHDNYSLLSKLELFQNSEQEKSVCESRKYLEKDEINILLEYMSSRELWHWYFFTNMLLLTGMRIGELIALKDGSVDMNNRVIHIVVTYDYRNGVVTTPKTDKSVRDIHIQPELALLIKKCRLWRKQMLLANGLKSNLFIPCIHTGSCTSYDAYCKFLREVSEHELNQRITPHKLRHTHASLLAEAGMTDDQIARRLGHNRSKVTHDIYIHVTKKMSEADNAIMDTIFLTS